MTPEAYVRAVKEQLRSTRGSRQIIRDLEELLGTGLDPAELGSPAEYVALVSEPSTARHSRVWDPMNPHLFVPRVVGVGWDLNLGALAVKLGWLRPDDMDSDVVAAIPEPTMMVSRSLPLAATVVTVTASWIAYVRSPHQLPTNWGLTFAPAAYGKSVVALAPGLILSLGATLWSRGGQRRDDQLSRAVYATSLSTIGAGTAVLAARSTWKGAYPQPVLGALSFLVLPMTASLAAGLIPVRQGLRKIWREAGLYE